LGDASTLLVDAAPGSRPLGARSRPSLAAALLVVLMLLSTVCMTRSAYAYAAGDALSPRVVSVRSMGPNELAVRLVVSRRLSGAQLPNDAFSAGDGGLSLSLTARPLGTADLQLAVAIDTGVPAAALAIEQGVVREFLLRLPPSTVMSLIDAQSGTVLGPAGPPDQALSLLARLQSVPRKAQSADRWLVAAVARVPAPSTWQSILYVGSNGPTGTASDAVVRQVRNIPVMVNELLLDEAPSSNLAALTGGRLVQAGDDQQLLAGADRVADDLAGTYELLIHTTAPAQLRVIITAPAVGRTEVPVATRSLAGSPTTQTEGSSDQKALLDRRPPVLVSFIVGLGLVLAVGALGFGKDQRRSLGAC